MIPVLLPSEQGEPGATRGPPWNRADPRDAGPWARPRQQQRHCSAWTVRCHQDDRISAWI